jgi:hypothetical protein
VPSTSFFGEPPPVTISHDDRTPGWRSNGSARSARSRARRFRRGPGPVGEPVGTADDCAGLSLGERPRSHTAHLRAEAPSAGVPPPLSRLRRADSLPTPTAPTLTGAAWEFLGRADLGPATVPLVRADDATAATLPRRRAAAVLADRGPGRAGVHDRVVGHRGTDVEPTPGSDSVVRGMGRAARSGRGPRPARRRHPAHPRDPARTPRPDLEHTGGSVARAGVVAAAARVRCTGPRRPRARCREPRPGRPAGGSVCQYRPQMYVSVDRTRDLGRGDVREFRLHPPSSVQAASPSTREWVNVERPQGRGVERTVPAHRGYLPRAAPAHSDTGRHSASSSTTSRQARCACRGW